MFALGIELLMRRAVMTRWDNREEPEWPPHPDRVFMALVAAWGQNDENQDHKGALEWLESLGPPALRVSLTSSSRTRCTVFVPVNDHCSPISIKGKTETPLGSVPFGRARNARHFPATIPDDSVFYLVWPDAVGEGEFEGHVDALCGQVTYLGHSSTPIRMWIEKKAVLPNLVPSDTEAEIQLRVFAAGRLAELVSRFNGQAVADHARLEATIQQLGDALEHAARPEKRELKTKLAEAKATRRELFNDLQPQTLRPVPSIWQGYSEPRTPHSADAAEGPFDSGLIVLRQIGGQRFPLESAGIIARATRLALMSRHGAEPPSWLSGHAADGTPSTIRRPAYLPLAFVGRENADGHVLGLAIAIPRELPESAVTDLYRLVAQHDGSNTHDIPDGVPYLSLAVRNPVTNHLVGNLELELDETNERNPRLNLRPSTWCRPSTHWATVTPLVMPLVPRRSLTEESVIARACTDAGYPRPVSIRSGLAPFFAGVSHAKSFHVEPRGHRPRLPVAHAIIEFPTPVFGPVIIGAGRYGGFGFCRPVRGEDQ